MSAEQPNKKMNPWTRDAAGAVLGSRDTPYANAALKEYMNDGVGSLKRILVAPKGYGKTFFLKYKSHLVRTHQGKGIPTFPDTHQDIEFLKLTADAMEMHAYVARLSIDQWSLLWQFVLICKALRIIDAVPSLQDDPYLSVLLRSQRKPVGDLLTEVIRDRDNFEANLSTRLRAVRERFNEEAKNAIVFIDNADEMFVGLDRLEQHRERKHKVATSAEEQIKVREADAEASNENVRANTSMWKAAQVGLLLAVRDIERSASRLCVYTTLRAEALGEADHPDALQAMSYVVPITYSEDDLVEIFGWHVDRMEADDLVSPSARHPAERMVGEALVEHRYVLHDGVPAREHIFDLILRHTTCSPRELVVVGGYIAMLTTKERSGLKRDAKVREAVDKAVAELWRHFRVNAIPRWEDKWTDALKALRSPVLHASDVSASFGVAGAKLYAFGLLGCSHLTRNKNEYRQVFLTTWDDGFGSMDRPLPKAEYYFLHPWLHDTAKKMGSRFDVETTSMIGNGCMYSPPARLIAITVTPDQKGLPSLVFADDTFDAPVEAQKMLTMPAAFFFAYLFACKKFGLEKIGAQQLEEGRRAFNARYPDFEHAEMIDPFNDADQASHLSTSLAKPFPTLAKKMRQADGQFSRLRTQSDPAVVVHASFLDLRRLVIT